MRCVRAVTKAVGSGEIASGGRDPGSGLRREPACKGQGEEGAPTQQKHGPEKANGGAQELCLSLLLCPQYPDNAWREVVA